MTPRSRRAGAPNTRTSAGTRTGPNSDDAEEAQHPAEGDQHDLTGKGRADQGRHTEGEDHRPEGQAYPSGGTADLHGRVGQRRHRRHPGAVPGRHEGRADGERGAGDEAAQHRAGGDGQVAVQRDGQPCHQRGHPGRQPDPDRHPEHRGGQADQPRLQQGGPEHLPPGGADQAQQRGTPGTLGEHDRERVGDDEGGHHHRHPGEGEQHQVELVEVAHRVGDGLVEDRLPGAYGRSRPDGRGDPFGEHLVGHPRVGGHHDPAEALDAGDRERVGADQADEGPADVPRGVGDIHRTHQGVRPGRSTGTADADRGAEVEALLGDGPLVEHHLAGTGGQPPGHQVVRLEGGVGGHGGEDPEAEYRSAVRADHSGRAGQLALGGAYPVDRAHPLDQ